MNVENYLKKLSSTEYSNISPGTQRINKVLRKLGEPQNSFPYVHIAGTNGKGSTAVMISSILSTAGYKTGLYTSPHLVSECERITINGSKIKKTELYSLIMNFLKFDETQKLTYFELLTVAGFLFFSNRNIDILVCETGLGGKLDATNVMTRALVTILTKIDFDHTELLGNSLKDIVKEKTGILREGVPLVISNQNKNTLKILRQSISGKNIPCFLYGRDFYAVKEFVDWRNSYQQFSFYQRNSSIKKLCTQLIGKHQIENAATAIQASLILKESGFNVSRDDIKDGISNAYWPGRFEYRNVTICGRKIKIIFDGAHNPDGIKSLKSTLLESKYSQGRKKFNFVFSVMKEKNYGEMIKIISPLINKIFLYRIKNKRALSINNLRKVLIRYVNPGDIVSVKSIKNILNKAEKDILLVITGSIYLVGEFLKSPTPFTKGGNH